MNRHAAHMPGPSRLIPIASCVLIMLFALMWATSAYAAPAGTTEEGEGMGIGALSDRYSSLSSLGNSLTEEQEVVIETRVGVLTSVNRALDDSDVRFKGEVVGDVVKAPQAGFKWANIAGLTNTVISVFLTDEQAGAIQYIGGYHNTGTSLMITGEYHIACPEHQGELDVHATNVEVVDVGGPKTHPVSYKRIHGAIMASVLGLFIVVGFFVTRRHLRKKAEE